MTSLDPFCHGRHSVLFLLEWTLTLGIDLPSLHSRLLPKPLLDLQNVIITTVVFHVTLLLIEEHTSQQQKWSSRPTIMEFTACTMCLVVLDKLV